MAFALFLFLFLTTTWNALIVAWDLMVFINIARKALQKHQNNAIFHHSRSLSSWKQEEREQEKVILVWIDIEWFPKLNSSITLLGFSRECNKFRT